MDRTEADAMRQLEETGRTVDEAVDRAARALGRLRDDLAVEVLDDGSRGVFGLGAREARVRVTVKGSEGMTPGKPVADVAREISGHLLALMGFEATVDVEHEGEVLRVEVRGEQLAGLIGKHGQTLEALEMLISQMVGRGSLGTRVELEVEGYRARRRQALEALARRTAARVLRERREIALDPMTPRERRILHTTLQGHPGVTTVSRGEGEVRRVVVMLRKEERETPPPVPAGSVSGQAAERASTAANPSRSDSGPQSTPRSRDRFNARPPSGSRRRERRPRQRTYTDSPGALPGSGSSPRDRDGVTRQVPQWRSAYGPGYGQAKRPSGRPEGLPSDEELEAEIQAHLEKARSGGSMEMGKDSNRNKPEDRSKGGADRRTEEGDLEE